MKSGFGRGLDLVHTLLLALLTARAQGLGIAVDVFGVWADMRVYRFVRAAPARQTPGSFLALF